MPAQSLRATFRRTAAPLTALALALTAPAAAEASDKIAFVDGTGSASSGVMRVAMRSSGANIGIGLAQTKARYSGAQGNAESAGVDMGMFDMIGKAPVACGTAPGAFLPEDARPERIVVSSGSGKTAEQSAAFGAGTPVEMGSQAASAAPRSQADAFVGGVKVDIPGLLTMVGGTATSSAHLVPGKQRTATATSSMGKLSLLGGAVELEGLQWQATERTGAVKSSEGSFSLGAITVGGQRYPAPDVASFAVGLAAANEALKAVGLALHAPEVEPTQTGNQVTPLRLSINSTPELRALLAPAMDGVQPIRTQLLELVSPLQMSPDCGFAKAVGFGYLIADLALIAMGDGGGLDLDLGGVRVGTDATVYANPLKSGFGALTPPDLPSVPDLPAEPAVTPADSAVPPAAPVPGPAAATVDAVTVTPTVEQVPVAAICRSTHPDGDGCADRHGLLAAWLALAFIVLLAAADFVRRRMT